MSEVPKYYTTLFNAVSEAIESIEAQNYGTAKRILLRGQYEAEGEFIVVTEREKGEAAEDKEGA